MTLPRRKFLRLAAGAAADFAPEVDAVGGEEQQTQPRLDRKRHQAESHFDHEHRDKPALVFDQARCVGAIGQDRSAVVVALAGGEIAACRPDSGGDQFVGAGVGVGAAAQQQHGTGHPVGDGGEDQRAAHGCADTDVADLGGGAGRDGDEGHHRLR